MGSFFTDEHMQEAIAALEDHTPGIWERMMKMALIPDAPHDEEQEIEQGAIVRVLTIALPKLAFRSASGAASQLRATSRHRRPWPDIKRAR